MRERADDLFFRELAVETASLFSTEFLVIFGPLFQLGFFLFLALLPLGWATWVTARRYEPGWLVAVVFAWYFLVLAAIQVRFAAQLAVFLALFSAVALVYLLAAVELARPISTFAADADSMPAEQLSIGQSDRATTDGGTERSTIRLPRDRTKLAYLCGIGLLVIGLNVAFVPGLIGQTTYSEAEIGAMTTIDDHADGADREYPENYVLTEWGKARMYNYFVNGESRRYGYARINYEPFLRSGHPDEQYEQFNGRVGYVVLTEIEDAPQGTTQSKLYDDLGAGDDATGHYRLLYSQDGVRTFVLVEGAVVEASVEPNARVTAANEVDVAGESFSYERSAVADENGTARVRVAYPGEYDVGGQRVQVGEEDVSEGSVVRVEE